VASVLVGARSPAEVEQALRWFAQPIPAELWPALRGAP
jgi:aryl-alcohol dehydrogenase-like predicted oxidoreductase